jgi:hypothetical protein
MPLKLFTFAQNPRAKKILVAASLAGIPVEVVELKKEDLNKPEHLKRYPTNFNK